MLINVFVDFQYIYIQEMIAFYLFIDRALPSFVDMSEGMSQPPPTNQSNRGFRSKSKITTT
uniref:Uncharacterized protein n=2 Tax=Picea TaxID=3328 RepID=A0A101M000_PICGL|nr:hypothetical protein ABT39_MTgene5377 [Picea glauca]QHR90238.1 hypothetical protein Q903MT_gene4261 [Picea sitchensis]